MAVITFGRVTQLIHYDGGIQKTANNAEDQLMDLKDYTKADLMEGVTVSRLFLVTKDQRIKELEDKVAALEKINRELTTALNDIPRG